MASRMVPEHGHRLKPFRTPHKASRRHLSFVKELPCVCCLVHGQYRRADDPMHLSAASALHGKEERGLGQKADDRWTLPGCRRHHDAQHSMGEMEFWRSLGIDPHLLALVLWGLSGDDHAARLALIEHAEQGGRRKTA